MSTPSESMPMTTDRDRTPDPVATIKPFRHPWIAGDDSCGECGEFFREHWWADAGDHGHTVCRLPERVEWVALTEGQVAALSDRTLVRVEWGGVATEGALHRDRTCNGSVNLHHSDAFWWAGDTPRVTVYVHPEDMLDPDADLIEQAARAAYGDRHYLWDHLAESSKDVYRRQARAVLAVFRGEQA